MINYLPPTSDYSSICRNKLVQASPWLSTITILYNPLGLNPLVKDQNVYVLELGLENLLLSASSIEYTSDFNPDSQVYSHKLSCVIYNSDYNYLQSIQSFLQENKFSLSISDGLIDYFIGVEGCQLQSSIIHNSQEQSLSFTIQALSSYNILPYTSIPYVPPVPPVKHIRGTLDPDYATNGGFTVNDVPYLYSSLELDENNAFDVQLPADTIIHTFNAEWLYGAYSPLLSIDLSEFDGAEDIESLYCAFKGNQYLESVILPTCNSVTTYEECFRGCTHLTHFEGPQSYNKVTSFVRCFFNCAALQEFSFGHWNIQSSPDCSFMFGGCSSLVSIDTDKLITVGSLMQMFSGCTSLQSLNLWGKTWAPTDCDSMFNGCSNLTNLSMWQMDITDPTGTPGSYSSNGMFNGCPSNLQIGFPSSHAHGYDLSVIGTASLSSYLGTVAVLDASYAGTYKSIVLSAAQNDYIDSIPLLQSYRVQAQAKGWSFWYH